MGGKNPVLGIGLAMIGCACSAIGYTLQKIAHTRADAEERQRTGASGGHSFATAAQPRAGDSNNSNASVSAPAASGDAPARASAASERRVKPSYWRYWQFPAGLGMLVLGSVFAVVVFGLAGQAELAPMGAVTMVFNELLAWKILKEHFSKVDAAAVLLMGIGTTVALVGGVKADASYSLTSIIALIMRPAALAFTIVTLGVIFALMGYVAYLERRPPAQLSRFEAGCDAFGRAFIGGMLGGFTGFLVKSVVEVVIDVIGESQWQEAARPEPYLFIVLLALCLFNQVKYMNSGLARYNSNRVIPVYQSTLVFASVLCGYVLWDEIAVQTSSSLGAFAGGCSVAMGGMLVLMLKPAPTPHTAQSASGSGDLQVATAVAIDIEHDGAALTGSALYHSDEDLAPIGDAGGISSTTSRRRVGGGDKLALSPLRGSTSNIDAIANAAWNSARRLGHAFSSPGAYTTLEEGAGVPRAASDNSNDTTDDAAPPPSQRAASHVSDGADRAVPEPHGVVRAAAATLSLETSSVSGSSRRTMSTLPTPNGTISGGTDSSLSTARAGAAAPVRALSSSSFATQRGDAGSEDAHAGNHVSARSRDSSLGDRQDAQSTDVRPSSSTRHAGHVLRQQHSVRITSGIPRPDLLDTDEGCIPPSDGDLHVSLPLSAGRARPRPNDASASSPELSFSVGTLTDVSLPSKRDRSRAGDSSLTGDPLDAPAAQVP